MQRDKLGLSEALCKVPLKHPFIQSSRQTYFRQIKFGDSNVKRKGEVICLMVTQRSHNAGVSDTSMSLKNSIKKL